MNDLTGQRYGHLTVLERSDRRTSTNYQWVCHCDCGKKLIVRGDNLVTGHSTQCAACSTRGGHMSVYVEGEDKNGG